jgi:hypothetical protein
VAALCANPNEKKNAVEREEVTVLHNTRTLEKNDLFATDVFVRRISGQSCRASQYVQEELEERVKLQHGGMLESIFVHSYFE